jgi:hypothetical protein
MTEEKPPPTPIDAIAAFERQTRVLVGLERRVTQIADEIGRVFELVTRLKLASDNAKETRLAQAASLEAIDKRLTGLEDRLTRTKPK